MKLIFALIFAGLLPLKSFAQNQSAHCVGYRAPTGVNVKLEDGSWLYEGQELKYDTNKALCDLYRLKEATITELYAYVKALHQAMEATRLLLTAKIAHAYKELTYIHQIMMNYQYRAENGMNPPPIGDLTLMMRDYFDWLKGLPTLNNFRYNAINLFLRSAALSAKALYVSSTASPAYSGGIYVTKSILLKDGTRYTYAVYLNNGSLSFSTMKYDTANPNGICILYESHYSPEQLPLNGSQKSEILGFAIAALAHPIIGSTPQLYQSLIGIKEIWSEVH